MLSGTIERVEESLLRLATMPGDGAFKRVLRGAGRGGWATLYHGHHPLARGRRARAVGNLWAWQAWRRLVKRPLLVELQTGTKLLCPTWSTIAGVWVSIGAHEPELFFVADVSRPGDLFVDVGANIGVYALTAALKGARAVAFEPTEAARLVIAENAALNGVKDSVTISALALSDYDGSAWFTVGQDCTNKLARNEAEQGVPTEVRKLDTCLAELASGRTPDIVKIDVEGADEAVLRGAAGTIARCHPTLIVEIWGGGHFIRSYLGELGYVAYAYDYGAHRLTPLPPDYAYPGNLVAVHPERLAAIEERLRSAPPWDRAGPKANFNLLRSDARSR
jgi:FkbM family methyltransferase